MVNGVELLSPAGNFETALAAFEAGADAVYCGLTEFSARAFADNFSSDDLRNLLRYSRRHNKKVYVTFNTVIDEDDFDAAIGRLALLAEIKPDALIVQDIGIARICRKYFPDLELHASTQLVAHNLEGVLAMKDLGFKRVVLARELSLEEISSIAKRCGDVELEVFIHGALCYSISGLCLFGAMEKGRSGNRGKCPYCCRQEFASLYPFSMKDLRLGEDVRKLADIGIASFKIEGRMKSAIYVASVTRYYRQILGKKDAEKGTSVTVADLETVFSRRTTKLYLDGRPGVNRQSPVDPESLGHIGLEIGAVKHVTKDREGLSWLRFHTSRALEKHDGLQFEAMVDGRHVGMGIVEMRQTISRRPVFEVEAGTDVEVQVSEDVASVLRPGMKIYCSMSNAVKRKFPSPSFRPSDYAGWIPLDINVKLNREGLTGLAKPEGSRDGGQSCFVKFELQAAKSPEKTPEAIRKAFAKLGDTDYRLGNLSVDDPHGLFAPMSMLNVLRRELVEKLDDARDKARREKIELVLADGVCDDADSGVHAQGGRRTVKVRSGQKIPSGNWNEVIVAIGRERSCESYINDCRLALPVYTSELDFGKLRVEVKRLLRSGFSKWEVSDLATLRMMRQLGVSDITADWTLYAFNSHALAELSGLGVKRFVASPENEATNLRYLSESGYDIEFLIQQSTPLFISLTEPAAKPTELAVFDCNGLWVTTKPVPRTFDLPDGVSTRLDLSWDPN